MLLIIDGYNVIKLKENSAGSQKLELMRNEFLESLIKYKGEKKHSIIVVFDGSKTSEAFENTENFKGIKVIYSKGGQQADDIIKRLVNTYSNAPDILVVSSDNEIVHHARTHGASVASSQELLGRIFPQYADVDLRSRKQSKKLSRYNVKLWR